MKGTLIITPARPMPWMVPGRKFAEVNIQWVAEKPEEQEEVDSLNEEDPLHNCYAYRSKNNEGGDTANVIWEMMGAVVLVITANIGAPNIVLSGIENVTHVWIQRLPREITPGIFSNAIMMLLSFDDYRVLPFNKPE